MERSDDRLSTRDIASPSSTDDARFERDSAATDAPPADDAGAVSTDRAARDYDDRAIEDERVVGDGDVVTDEPADRDVTSESIEDPAAAAGGGDPDATTPDADRADAEAGRPAPEAVAPPVPATDRGTTDDRETTADDGGTTDAAATGSADPSDAAPLLPDGEGFQSRWEEIQVRFVDEPRGAVEDADALVATVMQRLAEGFAQERERLESQWGRGEDISTEDLRVALQRYRSFFQRLLST
jgi:hypothetical protein